LHDLHLVIQSAFYWYNCHLYGFDLPGNNRLQACDITSGQWEGDQEDQVDSKKLLITDVLNEKQKYLHYEYDFGDGWRHTIQLEKSQDGVIEKPKLIKAQNFAPVEDCGGIWRWYENLERLKNYPAKPTADDKELLEWMAELIPDLDEENPKDFDPTKVNFQELAENIELYQESENIL